MEIGVIGCGTAGSAAAILLARAGHAVTVLERVAEPKPIGAGIIIQPTGQAVLQALELYSQVEARGTKLRRLYLRTQRGRKLVDLQYAKLESSWFGLGIHRGVLFQALYGAARVEERVTIVTGCDVRSLRRDGARTFAIDATGEEHGQLALVVIADGSVSELRGTAGETARDTPYPWGALWFVAPDPDRIFEPELYQVATRAHRLYGVLPTGLGPSGTTQVVSLFWSMRAQDLDVWRATDLETWKAEVRAHDPRIAFVLDAITSHDQLTFARYRDVAMKRTHDRGVVFIGDAAHATSPQLGQGANLALMDALELAEAVAATASVDDALDAYARARRGHVRHYQRMTRMLTPFFQSSSSFLGWLRDWTFPIANAIPPLRNHMIRTMCGVSRGFGRRALPLPR